MNQFRQNTYSAHASFSSNFYSKQKQQKNLHNRSLVEFAVWLTLNRIIFKVKISHSADAIKFLLVQFYLNLRDKTYLKNILLA